ncbi:type II and III secretion system protein family protein [Mangrovibrevibacter kandeliae]|uniref:type II and III secretion system protein family protein n=1 Tax=Mangrovibrevibacter kandeliae TaxID=2968473 RepID=UPI002117C44E|nr:MULTISPECIES: type II and III secretion system protein family protein [unclassified Aurantimonas]MCQ8783516.1 type II and III secretion system protein family protein [Aurantimonas sp. CSK15Z-1]MCW4115968.1 type II and III secretion system protein family protein [Aurantimonas sp. MSK8Z-1]
MTCVRTLRQRLLATALGALTAIGPCLASLPAAAAGDDSVISVSRPHQTITLGLDKSKVIDLPRDAHDILVANPAVADAITRTSRRIYIFGKQIGQTNIFVFDGQGHEVAVLDLRIERDIHGLEDTIRKYIPNSEVNAELLNDNVVLTGAVETPQDAARAVRLAEIYVTGGEATTSQYIKSASGSAGSGGSDVSQASEERQKSQIVNLLQIRGEDQVTLKVTVAEVQRSVVKQLGLDGTIQSTIDGIAFGAVSDSPFGLGKAMSSAGANIAGSIGSSDISGQLTALEQAGVMRTLAEPSLTAISGESASFKVGGEFQIADGKSETPETRTPILNAAGNIVGYDTTPATVDYPHRTIDYGIGLDFTPVVLSPGRISLKIRTSVSEPTFESPFSIPRGSLAAGVNLIGIRKRLADTSVELPSGGSLVIAGLVRDEARQVISGLPGLAKVPILGTLFRSRDFQHYETELVVIVTPYLVRPVARQDLARPDDGLNFTSDGSANFLGKINRVYGAMETKLPPGRYHGVVGYIYK